MPVESPTKNSQRLLSAAPTLYDLVYRAWRAYADQIPSITLIAITQFVIHIERRLLSHWPTNNACRHTCCCRVRRYIHQHYTATANFCAFANVYWPQNFSAGSQ